MLVVKKTVTIKEVVSEDWDLLVEVAKTFDLTMAEMIHFLADRFRFGTDSNDAMARLRAQRAARNAAVHGIVTGASVEEALANAKEMLERLQGVAKAQEDSRTLKAQTPVTSAYPDPATIGAFYGTYTAFRRCANCGGELQAPTTPFHQDEAWKCGKCGWQDSGHGRFRGGRGGRG